MNKTSALQVVTSCDATKLCHPFEYVYVHCNYENVMYMYILKKVESNLWVHSGTTVHDSTPGLAISSKNSSLG